MENTNLDIEKEVLRYQHQNIKTFSNINEALISVGNDIKEVKHKQEKITFTLFGVVFLAGLILGTQYKVWLPFVKDGYEVAKTVIKSKN